jgi:hypothetical protein
MGFVERMKFRGGLRYGNSFPDATTAMWPLARLQVEKEWIAISLPWRLLRFPRSHIKRLIKYSGYVAIGVQIEHTVLHEPNLVVFWTYHFADVKSHLAKNNFSFAGRT